MPIYGIEIPDEEKTVERVDQTPNQVFNYNAHGYIRNEIATLYAMQNADAYRQAIQRLQEFEKTSEYDESMSDSDNLKRVVSSKMQDPVEIQRVIDYQSSIEESRLMSERAKALEESKDNISFDNTYVPKSE